MPSEVNSPASSRFRGMRPLSGSAVKVLQKSKLIEKPEQPAKQGEMYPVQWPPYDNNDVEKRINGVLGPLSLFAPFPHEDIQQQSSTTMSLERPVTPINEEIKSRPLSFEKLTGYIRRRLCPQQGVPHLTMEEQRLLSGILMGEVTSLWPEIRQQIEDPFLGPKDNRELNRRIAVHIVTVCEQLFNHYLEKAEVLNRRGIFSGPANMSRLKAQLSLDANKFLNINTIRRYLVADMRGLDDDLDSPGPDEWYQRAQSIVTAPPPRLSYRGLIETSRPKSRTKRNRFKSPEQETRKVQAKTPSWRKQPKPPKLDPITRMLNQMPKLNTEILGELIAEMPDRRIASPSEASEAPPSRISQADSSKTGYDKEAMSRRRVVMKRSNSLPEVESTESLMEELGISADIKIDPLEQHEVQLLQNENKRNSKNVFEVVQLQAEAQAAKENGQNIPKLGTREYIRNDLRLLIGVKEEEEIQTEEDMPPLIQAITRHARHDGQRDILEKKLKELEERELREHQRRSVPIRMPTHVQPSTVSTKLPNQVSSFKEEGNINSNKTADVNYNYCREATSVSSGLGVQQSSEQIEWFGDMDVRTSDIRVSERVCMSSITLDRYTTVYNDLIEEIDAQTVKQLDRNLFLGEEIREVYGEIMNTIPTNHLELDDDDAVVAAPDSVNMSGTMASASLTRKRNDRVINPSFMKTITKPPWGDLDQKAWVKTPNNPPKNFQGEDVFAPIRDLEDILRIWRKCTPNMERVHTVLRNPTKMTQMANATEEFPAYVQDKVARTYASWLQWWKSTITSDDYLKYLSTQETDYMAAVFHFYDSGDEDADDNYGGHTGRHTTLHASRAPGSRATQTSKQKEATRERRAKVEAMKCQKEEFKEGFWNVNTVMLGGLGKEPLVEEEVEETTEVKAPKSADTQRSNKTLQERALARQSAQRTREATQSRLSKGTTLTSASKYDADRSSVAESIPHVPSPQDRLEKVWSSLEMPDAQKLDMAIKYSGNTFFNRLEQAIGKWERVTDFVLRREELLVKLEKFERMASDPNRFFDKGSKRSSVGRLKEAQQRSYYYKRIDSLDIAIKHQLEYITNNLKDVITYKGRPYVDKMKWDRVEMLHWLQEERKQNAIRYEAITKNLPLKSAQLDPIPFSLVSQKVT